ncbi:DUF6456 domain-containing protein [Actibacterium sp. MT2.3-13A]|uniref:DUF6456 domain-containing protein n=1 Tax=Actibacterium sp. MT2.3-13A TaxID=2828332 RepID=UPI001BA92E78|nr:DUF6456 domain-containing protein [Actibacterium sp. MT2.3-13A]
MGNPASPDSSHAVAPPPWLPQPTYWYLAHTEAGQSLRALARSAGCHASTILRHVRRLEQRRDDPLCDSALAQLGRQLFPVPHPRSRNEDCQAMTAFARSPKTLTDGATLNREARRILRRLCETGAFLAIAPEMDKAVVLKQMGQDAATRIGVLDRAVAEAFVLKDWISCAKPGRVTTYRITQAGRSALKRMLAEEAPAAAGFSEAARPFADQHRDWGTRVVMEPGAEAPRALRANLAESPLALLARRRDRNGQPFLTPDLVAAGERLREDFELAQMGPRVTQNWDRFLTGGERGSFAGAGPAEGSRGARDRVTSALRDLGPGLGDVVLRCCCYLEGMEAAEKRMGWSARSGKVVLRIALQRLKRHYEELSAAGADLIG